MPLREPSEARLMACLISSYEAGFWRRQVRSTTETSGVGTRKAIPVSLPLSEGMTLPTALAAPVELGMTLAPAERPARQSLPPLDGPSTVSWLAVAACTVVMSPSTMPNSSWMTLASGARQLVVHEALETMSWPLYSVWLTPITNMGVSSLGGAEMMTFLQPPLRWALHLSAVVNTPVDSHTYSAPASPQGMLAGSFSALTRMRAPLTMRPSLSCSTVPSQVPCTESYLNR
mmetsp:Transcript_1334/g.3296  ORF Transcript_1334/g.3296 Transcript_1334/m.3296 type:complete len:231 (+) Transcript_1334:240-932(+)